MKLNILELALMNNPIRAGNQRWVETPFLIGPRGMLTGRRVLEVGCGRGVGLEILLSLGAAHVTAFDLDLRMVALAQKQVAKHGERVHVFVGDAEAIDAPDADFDAGVEYGILHHVPNWPQAFREITRVLKPEGTFCFEDLLKGFISAWAHLRPVRPSRPASLPSESSAPGWKRSVCKWRNGVNGGSGRSSARPARGQF